MARTSTQKDTVKSVNYLNKDFNDFKGNLIEFAKQYFPDTYNDFNEASPGMLFIEMASYVGDVLSYYIDSQFRESLLAYAEEKKNVYNIAQSFGYKPKTTSPSEVVLNVFQTVPALNGNPDYRYALTVDGGTQINANSNGTTFRTLEDCNFKYSSSYDKRDVTIFETDSGEPTKFLLKKKKQRVEKYQQSFLILILQKNTHKYDWVILMLLKLYLVQIVMETNGMKLIL